MTTVARYRQLRLVVGPSGPAPHGIQEAFVEEVRLLKRGDPLRPLLVLVGSNYVRLHLSRLLAARLGGHANIRFTLLDELARQYGTPPLVDRGRRRLPDLGRELVLRESAQARAHGTCFEVIAGKEGFLEALGATLLDLKAAGVDPSSLRAAAAALRTPSGRKPSADRVAKKLEDLADLHEAYEDRLRETRFYDDQDVLREAVARAEGEGCKDLMVYGFYDATWLQRDLIKSYLGFKKGVVFFPSDAPPLREADDERSDYGRPLLEWFRTFVPELTALTPGEGHRGPETRILSAPGEPREAMEAIRWLVGVARDGSVPYGELALLYRTPDPWLPLLVEILDAAEVPHVLAGGQPLDRTRAARALLLLLQVRVENLARRPVIDLFSLTHEEEWASSWGRASMVAGVVRGIDDWRARLARFSAPTGAAASGAAAEDDRDFHMLRGPAKKLLKSVEELHEGLSGLPESGTWRDIAQRLLQILERCIGRDPSFARVAEQLTALGALDDVNSPVDLSRFAEVLARALERPARDPERDGHFQRSGIFIGDVIDARLLSFHAVAVVGLVERTFPRPPRQDPILLDDEREHINRLVGAARLPVHTRRLDEERLYFTMACRAAAGNLLLSYPRLDPASARPRSASPFLLRAASDLEGRPIDHHALDRLERTTRISLAAPGPERAADALLPREFDLSLLRTLSPDTSEAVHRRRLASFVHGNPILQRALKAEEARWGESRFTPHDGVIVRPALLDALRSIHDTRAQPLSSYRIESYARCPLAYFMQNVLGLKDYEDPEKQQRLDPLRKGSLVHDILFDVFTHLRARGVLVLTPETLEVGLEVLEIAAERCFAAEEQRGTTGIPLFWQIDKERIVRDLSLVLRNEAAEGGAYEPRYFEFRFGADPRAGSREDPDSTTVPVDLDVPGGAALRIKGVVDRIDVSADGSTIRVTDYKTGRVTEKYKANLLKGGRTVQLPLYMLAVDRLVSPKHGGARTEVARYLSVDRRGEFKTVAYDAETMEQRRADLAQIATTFANGVARGVFFAYPEEDECRWCDYKLACGEGREARLARKRGDETAADFMAMREGIQ